MPGFQAKIGETEIYDFHRLCNTGAYPPRYTLTKLTRKVLLLFGDALGIVMRQWCDKSSEGEPVIDAEKRAVAYYRQASQSINENSIVTQQETVRAWAMQHDLTIINEFCDWGKSGSTAEGRPAFLDLIENWVKKRNDFKYIICLDVTRWGRFIDIDSFRKYSSECKLHGKEIVYINHGRHEDWIKFRRVLLDRRYIFSKSSNALSRFGLK